MAKASDILDDQSNSTGYLKTTDLDNFFYIHLDDKYRYMYNLNAALYLNTGSSSLKTFICDAVSTWSLLSYKIYGTPRLAWLLLKLNNVKTEDIFKLKMPGDKIKCLNNEDMNGILQAINDDNE